MIERNAVSYDISTPLGILGVATFLIKLRVEVVPQILKKLGDVQARLQDKRVPLGGTSPNSDKASWRKTRAKPT